MSRPTQLASLVTRLVIGLLPLGQGWCQEPPAAVRSFLATHCLDCHDADSAKGRLDLSALPFAPAEQKNSALWVKVHDRVRAGEMPPKKQARPPAAATSAFLAALAEPLTAADLARENREGRATWRRLNRDEYEQSIRDLLQAPWLQVKNYLPEDGEANRFNKVGEALDISHIQMAQYLAAADYALRAVLATAVEQPASDPRRFYARDQNSFANKMFYNEFNRHPERATFPVLAGRSQPAIRSGKEPVTVGDKDPATRDREAVGTVASSYEPIELFFNKFRAPSAGRFRIRLQAYSVWVGPGKERIGKSNEIRWWRPDLDTVTFGRRPEPVTISAEGSARQVRWLGAVDVGPAPTNNELEVWLQKGDSIRVDAARLFRSRPGGTGVNAPWRNPLAERDGQPGVAFQWLEVTGPLPDPAAVAGQRLLTGDLPLKRGPNAASPQVLVPKDEAGDGERLIRNFITQAYRRPVTEAEVRRYVDLLGNARASGNSFTEALLATYSGILCSPGFICLEEPRPGPLAGHALAARLAYFLWNSPPDAELRELGRSGKLTQPKVLTAQAERLLADPRAKRFTDAFLAYWLDLRRMDATSPDAELYPDYYLDDLLVESATLETQAFFTELIQRNLPASNVVAADFAMLNERLAAHYGLPAVDGVAIRKVALPANSVRGGLMTQASVLKVTANGTTTSPVVRGAWIMERILGLPPPPPPPNIPAVEPDIRGAKTIREQLAKHRNQESCASCHTKIDPAGFALEAFDIFGGQRDRYRATGEGDPVAGFGKNGHAFAFHAALKVDTSGNLPDGRSFTDVRGLKQLLLTDQRQIARNLISQFTVYATGAPIHFADRARIETLLDRCAADGFRVRSLLLEVVTSPLFTRK